MIIYRKVGRIRFVVGQIKIGIKIFFSGIRPLAICIRSQYIAILVENVYLSVCFVVMSFGDKILIHNGVVNTHLGVKRNTCLPLLTSFFGKYLDHPIRTL